VTQVSGELWKALPCCTII